MKNVLYRFLAYLIVGFASGFAVWLFFQSHLGLVRGLGFAALALGLAAATYLFRKANAVPSAGIRTNPAWSVFAMDSVCLVAAATAIFFVIDGFSERLGGPPAMIAEPLVSDVIAFMFLPSAFIFALIVAQSGSQSLAIDNNGLVVTGPFGVEKFGWQEIARLHTNSQYVPVSRLGVPVPRHLRTNLKVIAKGGKAVTIFEPGLAKDRRTILSALTDHAPRDLQNDLAGIKAAWS